MADDGLALLNKPTGVLIHSVTSPLKFAFLSDSKASAEAAPSRVARSRGSLLRKLGSGVLGAAYVCLVLLAALVVAVVAGFGLVRLMVEEPVSLMRTMHFDYTEVNPSAFVALGGKARAVPPGHTFSVSLAVVMPESDHNREIGIFQLTADVIGSTGEVTHKSSQPCMLRFRSFPVRLMRTFTMAVPLLLGISGETQKLAVEVLRYREESSPRTEAIRVSMSPRAGTGDLPQLYHAELLMRSELPWGKELAHRWKWTLCVWASLYAYIMLLLALGALRFGPPALAAWRWRPAEAGAVGGEGWSSGSGDDDGEVSDAVRRSRERRVKRRRAPGGACAQLEAVKGSEAAVEEAGRGEMGEVINDPGEFAASESSECVGGC